ncbi:MAG: leucine-rich repeat protein [Eubacteriaceae bacterium]
MNKKGVKFLKSSLLASAIVFSGFANAQVLAEDNSFIENGNAVAEVNQEITILANEITIDNMVFALDDITHTASVKSYSSLYSAPLDIPGNIWANNENYTVTDIAESAFAYKQLTSVTIPESIISIGDYAFYYDQLKSVVIPNSVITIGTSAFSGNPLSNVILGNSIQTIGSSAFYKNPLTCLIIPDSVTEIGTWAFRDCKLTNVDIPESVRSIGGEAFYNNQLENLTLQEGITTIGEEAFAINHLTNVIIPNSVTTIGTSAFYKNQLVSINIPNGITTIAAGTFAENRLTEIAIPSSVTSIWHSAFTGNPLEFITLSSFKNPDEIKAAFTANEGLRGITANFVKFYTLDQLVASYADSTAPSYVFNQGDSFTLSIGAIDYPQVAKYDTRKREWTTPDRDTGAVTIEWYQKNDKSHNVLVGIGEVFTLTNVDQNSCGLYYAKINNSLQLSDIAIDVKVASQVHIQFHNENGNTLAPSLTLSGFSGTPYSTTPKTIAGYKLYQTPDNHSGFHGDDEILVTYIYHSVDNLSFNARTNPKTGNPIDIPLMFGELLLVLIVSTAVFIFVLFKNKNHFNK